MSRRALSDNLDRVVDTGDEATATDGRFSASMMLRAISLTKLTQPHPNPRVGAVVVADGAIVGAGAHQRAGEPHAEVLALDAAGALARGATVYVTLEPCSHHGQTPPCVDALIEAEVGKVVVGMVDPDERVSGSGLRRLREAGISVESGVAAAAVEANDPGYFHHRRTGLPLVTLKLATTLDGQIAAADRTSKWITSEEARRDGHGLRSEADVVVVGAGTVLDDDPRLDVRLDGYAGRQPRPVVVAGARTIPERLAVLERGGLVYSPRPLPLAVEQVTLGGEDRVDVSEMLKDLGRRGYVSALVEGGATLAGELVRGGHVDRIVFYLAARLGAGAGIGAFGGRFETIAEAVQLKIKEIRRIGPDLRIDAEVGN